MQRPWRVLTVVGMVGALAMCGISAGDCREDFVEDTAGMQAVLADFDEPRALVIEVFEQHRDDFRHAVWQRQAAITSVAAVDEAQQCLVLPLLAYPGFYDELFKFDRAILIILVQRVVYEGVGRNAAEYKQLHRADTVPAVVELLALPGYGQRWQQLFEDVRLVDTIAVRAISPAGTLRFEYAGQLITIKPGERWKIARRSVRHEAAAVLRQRDPYGVLVPQTAVNDSGVAFSTDVLIANYGFLSIRQ